jgi:multidrug efflux pump subunit AcrA (membrane-fusion protein)
MTKRMRRAGPVAIGLVVVAGGWWAWAGRSRGPTLPTGPVTRGDFSDVVEIRGDVRPIRSTIVGAPSNAGELVILKIARNGTAVKAGDVVAEFDAVAMRRTIQEKQSDLRGAMAELEQARAQSTITLEERSAAVRKAQFEVEKAKLSVTDVELVGSIENERSKLALSDAEQRLREAKAAENAARVAAEADFAARDRRIESITRDLARAQQAVQSLAAVAPIDGVVNIMSNYRAAGPMIMGSAPEFRPGDKTYAGAAVLELPDLSSVFLVARLDETERGLLHVGQTASIRADAIADRDYQAAISDISLLARVDFSGGWPPTKQFDLKITFTNPDGRLRPGMSAVARIGVGQIKDVLIVPAKAIFTEGGRPVVYRFRNGAFQAVPIDIIRRGHDQAAIKGDLQAGDQVALVSPVEQTAEGGV